MRFLGPLIALTLGLSMPLNAAPDLSSDCLLRDHLWRHFLALPKARRPRVGLVLSAGSLRATAHVGVISVLENAGYPIDLVAGTSMGAVIGSLYAGGMSVKKLWQIASGLKVTSGSNINAVTLLSLFLSNKLLSSQKAEAFVREQIGGKRFDQLNIPFACVAMDLYSGEGIVFREGEIAPAVRASMNIPGMFEPVEYRHRYLVDGGVVDYIPVDAAKLLGADYVLASVAETDYTHTKPSSVLQSLEQVIDIRGSLLSREQRKQANFLIEPPVGDIGMYQSHRIPEAMTKGVIAANQKIKAAMESLILFSMGRLLPDFLPEDRRERIP